jgi:hypothetical protein
MTDTYRQRERWTEYRRALGLPVDDASWKLATAPTAPATPRPQQTKLADVARQAMQERGARQADLYYREMEAATDRP